MTRAAAARAAAELADTAPGSVMEEEDEDEDEDMDEDLTNTHAMQLHMVSHLTTIHLGRTDLHRHGPTANRRQSLLSV